MRQGRCSARHVDANAPQRRDALTQATAKRFGRPGVHRLQGMESADAVNGELQGRSKFRGNGLCSCANVFRRHKKSVEPDAVNPLCPLAQRRVAAIADVAQDAVDGCRWRQLFTEDALHTLAHTGRQVRLQRPVAPQNGRLCLFDGVYG